jgi:hypothetical protein
MARKAIMAHPVVTAENIFIFKGALRATAACWKSSAIISTNATYIIIPPAREFKHPTKCGKKLNGIFKI